MLWIAITECKSAKSTAKVFSFWILWIFTSNRLNLRRCQMWAPLYQPSEETFIKSFFFILAEILHQPFSMQLCQNEFHKCDINFNQLFTRIFISNGFSLLYFFPSVNFMNLSHHGHLWIAPFSLGSLARAILGNLRAGLSYHSKIIAIIPRSSSLPTLRLGHWVG